MSATKKLVFDILAKDHAGETFKKIGKETENTGSKMKKFKVAAAAGLAAVGAAAVAYGKSSVNAYQDVVKETSMLSRVTGLTIKESSRLRFAAEESGVTFTTLSTSTRLFSKNLVAAGASSKTTHKLVQALGFSFKDAHGKLLPMDKLLPKVADKFKKMPDGPAKTALAMKLFGRSGGDMIKLLNKGSDGLKEFAKESDKTGNTLSNTDGYKKQLMAQRAFHAATEGLKVQIGQALQPILTALAQFLTDHVAPAFEAVTGWVTKHKAIISKVVPIIATMVAVFGTLVGILKVFEIVMAGVNLVLDANPIGLIVIALAALAVGLIYAYKHCATFRSIVNGAFHAIAAAAKFMWNDVLKPTFKFLVNAFLNVASSIVNGAAHAFGWVPGIGGKLKKAAAWFNTFKQHVNDQLNGIHDRHVKVTAHVYGISAVNGLIQSLTKVHSKDVTVSAHVGTGGGLLGAGLGHNARGTGYWRGGLSVVGEEGPEVVNLPRGSQVIPAGRSAQMMGGGGDTYNINVYGVLDGADGAKKIHQLLLKRKRTQLSGQPLGLG